MQDWGGIIPGFCAGPRHQVCTLFCVVAVVLLCVCVLLCFSCVPVAVWLVGVVVRRCVVVFFGRGVCAVWRVWCDTLKKLQSVDSKRLRVYTQSVPVCTGTTSTCMKHVDLSPVHKGTL